MVGWLAFGFLGIISAFVVFLFWFTQGKETENARNCKLRGMAHVTQGRGGSFCVDDKGQMFLPR